MTGVQTCALPISDFALEGQDGQLREIRWRRKGDGSEHSLPARQLFLFIGADPNTDWLAKTGIALDPQGFVVTGRDAGPDKLPLESSRPGIFAVGDVRHGSVKRVASAVGEGSIAVRHVHDYLALALQAT